MGSAQPKFTTDVVIEAIENTQGLVSLAARQLRCHPDTVRAYAKRHPSVADALAQARSHMTDVAELALFSAIQEKQGWAVCFYLKTQGKARGYVERHEVSGPEGGPIIFKVVFDGDDDSR